MPAVSKKNNTSFKQGNVPWNKKEKIKKICQTCNIEFLVGVAQSLTRPCKYCSKKCCNEGFRNSTADKCLELSKQGKTSKEIAFQLNIHIGTVSSHLNRKQYRKRQNGISYSTVIKNFKKIHTSCEICGFNRFIEAAHIIPVAKEGPNTFDNLLALCANHHYLFDNKQLLLEEAQKLSLRVNNFLDFVRREG
jgi:hypothetical protein